MREAAISQAELMRLLESEFPQTFNPDTGLVILEIWHGGGKPAKKSKRKK